MLRFIVKVLITSFVIVTVSELGKKYSAFAAILAALPLTSILAITWLYVDTKDASKISELSIGIFWAVLPSFVFFLSLPWLLRNGVRFAVAMPLSCLFMVLGYGVYVWAFKQFGVQL